MRENTESFCKSRKMLPQVDGHLRKHAISLLYYTAKLTLESRDSSVPKELSSAGYKQLLYERI